MKKVLSFLVVGIICFAICYIVELKEGSANETLANASYGERHFDGCNSMNIGTAKKLGGNAYILIVYESYANERNVPEREKKRFRDAIFEATDWITAECGKSDVEHKFVIAEYNPDDDLKLPTSYDIRKDSPNSILTQEISYDFRNDVKKWADQQGCDNYLVVVCNEKSGCCWAYKEDIDNYWPGDQYLEGCVINTHVDGNLSSAIAHELLHCFGAWDLYGDIYRTEDNTIELKSKLSNSVMTTTSEPLSELSIDDLTRYLTGISNVEYDWFNKLAKNGAH